MVYFAAMYLEPHLQRFIDQLENELAQAGIERAAQPLKISSRPRYINSIAEAHRGAQAPIHHHHLNAMLALPCAPRTAR